MTIRPQHDEVELLDHQDPSQDHVYLEHIFQLVLCEQQLNCCPELYVLVL